MGEALRVLEGSHGESGDVAGRDVVNDLGGTGSGAGASNSAADDVVAEILAAGGRAVANYDSVSTRSGGQAITECAMDNFGRIDAVVNNAGFLRNKVSEDLGDAELDDIVDVHRVRRARL